MIPWLQKPEAAESVAVLTDAQVAGLFTTALLAMPLFEKACVMNRLLHGQPRVFAALLLREPRENPGSFRP